MDVKPTVLGKEEYQELIRRGGAYFHRVAEVNSQSRLDNKGTTLEHLMAEYFEKNIPVVIGKENGSTFLYAKK